MESDHHHSSNIILFDYSKQLTLFVEVSYLADINVLSKEQLREAAGPWH